MTQCRALASAMMVVAGAVVAYGLAGYLSTSEPFRELLLVFFVLPALPGLVLGTFMLLGHGWALPGLRVYGWSLIALAVALAFPLRVSVLPDPAFAVPFLAFCLGWWALSLRLGRDARE